jgi:glycosyltransferase involved in cell wall biosynthesis
MDKISAVIPTYNSAKTLKDCLEAIHTLSMKKSVEIEIVIVDAGSSDDTLRIGKAYTSKIIVSPGISRGAARNLGTKNATNKVIAFLDSDCIITNDWIDHLDKIHEALGSTVFAGPAVLVNAKTSVGAAARDLLSNQFFTLSSFTFSIEADQREVDDVPSSNILVSKAFFEQIGGFPDLNFNEDGVFCKRVVAHRGKIVYFPAFKVIHKKTFDKVSRFAGYFLQYGRSYARNLGHYPELINRYGILAIFCAIFLMVSIILVSFLDTQMLIYFVVAVPIFFVFTLFYSVLKYKKVHSVIIPMLFLILVFSYLGGSYYGFLENLYKRSAQ